jgi:hypothetical protein
VLFIMAACNVTPLRQHTLTGIDMEGLAQSLLSRGTSILSGNAPHPAGDDLRDASKVICGLLAKLHTAAAGAADVTVTVEG